MSDSLRIAIADDEPLIRRFYQEVLAAAGHRVVVSAADGAELVRLCETEAIDLLVTDIKMPELDGIDAALAITARQHVPVLLVSAFHDDDLLARAEACKVMAYLVKPIERAQLEAAIRMARSRFAQVESLERETAELRQALEDRKLIERAKGILMRTLHLDEPAAFRRLQQIACDTNQKLVIVARTILEAAPKFDDLKPKRR